MWRSVSARQRPFSHLWNSTSQRTSTRDAAVARRRAVSTAPAVLRHNRSTDDHASIDATTLRTPSGTHFVANTPITPTLRLSNTELDPRGVDHDVFEESTREYVESRARRARAHLGDGRIPSPPASPVDKGPPAFFTSTPVIERSSSLAVLHDLVERREMRSAGAALEQLAALGIVDTRIEAGEALYARAARESAERGLLRDAVRWLEVSPHVSNTPTLSPAELASSQDDVAQTLRWMLSAAAAAPSTKSKASIAREALRKVLQVVGSKGLWTPETRRGNSVRREFHRAFVWLARHATTTKAKMNTSHTPASWAIWEETSSALRAHSTAPKANPFLNSLFNTGVRAQAFGGRAEAALCWAESSDAASIELEPFTLKILVEELPQGLRARAEALVQRLGERAQDAGDVDERERLQASYGTAEATLRRGGREPPPEPDHVESADTRIMSALGEGQPQTAARILAKSVRRSREPTLAPHAWPSPSCVAALLQALPRSGDEKGGAATATARRMVFRALYASKRGVSLLACAKVLLCLDLGDFRGAAREWRRVFLDGGGISEVTRRAAGLMTTEAEKEHWRHDNAVDGHEGESVESEGDGAGSMEPSMPPMLASRQIWPSAPAVALMLRVLVKACRRNILRLEEVYAAWLSEAFPRPTPTPRAMRNTDMVVRPLADSFCFEPFLRGFADAYIRDHGAARSAVIASSRRDALDEISLPQASPLKHKSGIEVAHEAPVTARLLGVMRDMTQRGVRPTVASWTMVLECSAREERRPRRRRHATHGVDHEDGWFVTHDGHEEGWGVTHDGHEAAPSLPTPAERAAWFVNSRTGRLARAMGINLPESGRNDDEAPVYDDGGVKGFGLPRATLTTYTVLMSALLRVAPSQGGPLIDEAHLVAEAMQLAARRHDDEDRERVAQPHQQEHGGAISADGAPGRNRDVHFGTAELRHDAELEALLESINEGVHARSSRMLYALEGTSRADVAHPALGTMREEWEEYDKGAEHHDCFRGPHDRGGDEAPLHQAVSEAVPPNDRSATRPRQMW